MTNAESLLKRAVRFIDPTKSQGASILCENIVTYFAQQPGITEVKNMLTEPAIPESLRKAVEPNETVAAREQSRDYDMSAISENGSKNRAEPAPATAHSSAAMRLVARMRNQRDDICDHLRWILPMAKGYAHEHLVGGNDAKVAAAEKALAAIPSREQQVKNIMDFISEESDSGEYGHLDAPTEPATPSPLFAAPSQEGVGASADAGTPETDKLISFGRDEDMKRGVDDLGHYMAQVSRLSSHACVLERERNALRTELSGMQKAWSDGNIVIEKLYVDIDGKRKRYEKAEAELGNSRSVTKLYYETIKKLQAELEAARREIAELKAADRDHLTAKLGMEKRLTERAETAERALADLRKAIEAAGEGLPNEPAKEQLNDYAEWLPRYYVTELRTAATLQLAAKDERIAALEIRLSQSIRYDNRSPARREEEAQEAIDATRGAAK